MIKIFTTESVVWESYISKDKTGDSIFSPPQTLAVKQVKSYLTSGQKPESTESGFLRVYLCLERSVKPQDRFDGKLVTESRDILDVFGKYVYTKVYVKI